MRLALILLLLAGCAAEPQIFTPRGGQTTAPTGYSVYCERYPDAKECGGVK